MAGFFAVRIPYCQIPYSQVALPDTLYDVGILVVILAAAVSCAFGKVRFLAATFIVGASVPAAIFMRVAVETSIDPTSHNLWPFEIIIAAAVGMFCSLAGAMAGSLYRYFIGNTAKVSNNPPLTMLLSFNKASL